MIRRLWVTNYFRTYVTNRGVVCISCYENLTAAPWKTSECASCGGQIHISDRCMAFVDSLVGARCKECASGGEL